MQRRCRHCESALSLSAEVVPAHGHDTIFPISLRTRCRILLFLLSNDRRRNMAGFSRDDASSGLDEQQRDAIGGKSCDPWWPQDWVCERLDTSSVAADSFAWCSPGPVLPAYPDLQLDW